MLLFLLLACFPPVLPDPGLQAFEFERGIFRGSLNGSFEFRAPVAFNGDTAKEEPTVLLRLKPSADLGEHVRFYAEIEGGYDGSMRSPENDGLFHRLDQVYPSRNRYIEVSEAYLDLYLSIVDLRLGIQKFSWGTLDQFNPTDNLNPWNLRHPFTTDPLERKIGIPAVRALFGSAMSSVLVEAVWVPFYVPYRLPDRGDRWYPPLFYSLEEFDPAKAGLPPGLPPMKITQINDEVALPPRTFSNGDFGIRLSRTIRNVDIGISYFNGYDRQPVFGSEGTITAVLRLLPPGVDLSYLFHLRPELHRIQTFGFDAAASWGSFTFRAEGAYHKSRYVDVGLASVPEIARSFILPGLSELEISPHPNGVAIEFPFSPRISYPKNILSLGGGMDYQWGSHLFTVQLVGNTILNHHGEPLVYETFELNLVLGVHSRFLDDTLSVESGLVVNPMEGFVMGSTQADYAVTDAVTVGATLFLLDGDGHTPLGQYAHNDQVEFHARYSF